MGQYLRKVANKAGKFKDQFYKMFMFANLTRANKMKSLAPNSPHAVEWAEWALFMYKIIKLTNMSNIGIIAQYVSKHFKTIFGMVDGDLSKIDETKILMQSLSRENNKTGSGNKRKNRSNGGNWGGNKKPRPNKKGKKKAKKVACRNFNTSEGCSYNNCRFPHVCSRCGSKGHYASNCSVGNE